MTKERGFLWLGVAALIVGAAALGVNLKDVGQALLWVKEFMP